MASTSAAGGARRQYGGGQHLSGQDTAANWGHHRRHQHQKSGWSCGLRKCLVGLLVLGGISVIAIRVILHLGSLLAGDSRNLKLPGSLDNQGFVDSLHVATKIRTEELHLKQGISGTIDRKSDKWSIVYDAENRSRRVVAKSPQIDDDDETAVIRGEPYVHPDLLRKDYEEMVGKLKIFVYPHEKGDPFRNIVEPMKDEPSGNYASESYFKKALLQSRFITTDPSEADLFYMPFSIARMRNDRRIGVKGIQDFVKEYMSVITNKWPYWNRTGGADHFYLSCHSVSRDAMRKAGQVRANAIQLVCSSSYFLHGFIPHKDASVPQIWPRKDSAKGAHSVKQRKTLAFFAGAGNSPVRAAVVEAWSNDTEIKVYGGRISSPYSTALLTSKFCLHVKGFEVNTARIGDAIYYGCVPLIIANHYDLPFNDFLDWQKFSVVVVTADIPLLKDTLKNISDAQYRRLQRNVIKVKKHFLWHDPPEDYDTFHMIMYELWLRRHILRYPL